MTNATMHATHRLARCAMSAVLACSWSGLLAGPVQNPGEASALPFGSVLTTIAEPEPFNLPEPPASWSKPRAFKPRPIFFPPVAPPLTATTALPPPGLNFGAPEEMEAFVGDAFYASLGSKLAVGRLSARERRWLEDYRAERVMLHEELLARLDELASTEPRVRLCELENFARAQTPRIAELEASAEDFRSAGTRRVFLDDGAGNWNGMRTWKLGRGRLDRPRAQNRLFEFLVVRAAPFFQDGLSPAQRRLLREVAVDMESTVFAHEDRPPAAGFFTFFSPDTARVRLPANLPAGLAAQIAVYTAEKTALKSELGDALYEHDGDLMASTRTHALRELAAQQAPRLVALEEIAEDIRRELVSAADIERRTRPAPAVADAAEATTLGRGQNFAAAEARRRDEGFYEYDLAVLEPGLSPEQRRLLFSFALEKMRLPLPGAEIQPTALPGTIVKN